MAKQQAATKVDPKDSIGLEDELRKLGGDALGDDYVDAYSALSSLRGQMDEAPFRYYWELGHRMRSLTKREIEMATEAGKKCAHTGSKKLAALLGEAQAKVKLAGYVYDAFPTAQKLEKLLQMQRADGKSLSFFTVGILAMPSNAARINDLLAKACAENWSENDATDYLNSQRAVAPKPGGRQPLLPRNLATAIERWQRDTNETARYTENIFKPDVIDALVESSEVGAVPMSKIDALIASLDVAEQGIAKQKQMLARIKDAVTAKTAVTAVAPLATPKAVAPKAAAPVEAAPAAAPAAAPVVTTAAESAADRVRRARRATQNEDGAQKRIVVPV